MISSGSLQVFACPKFPNAMVIAQILDSGQKKDRSQPPSEELPGEAFKNRSSDWYEKRLASLSLFHDRLFGVKTGSVSGGKYSSGQTCLACMHKFTRRICCYLVDKMFQAKENTYITSNWTCSFGRRLFSCRQDMTLLVNNFHTIYSNGTCYKYARKI